MSASAPRRRRGRPKGSSSSKHRIVPVWKQNFDQEEFARILLLLAMHLDEEQQKTHKKSNITAHKGGGNHDQTAHD